MQIYAYNDQIYPNATSAENSHHGLAAISVLVGVNDSVTSNIGNIITDVSRVQYRGKASHADSKRTNIICINTGCTDTNCTSLALTALTINTLTLTALTLTV